MKTLAVIENELFKNYLKIVSTDNLADTLDDPNVPVPFTCLDSVNNAQSDLLAAQLSAYFQDSKIKNKDFYTLDQAQHSQLAFMLNLIKISSGDNSATSDTPVAISTANSDVKPVETLNAPVTHAPVVKEPVVKEEVKTEAAPVAPTVEPVEPVQATSELVEMEEDPFAVKAAAPEGDIVHNEDEPFDPFKTAPVAEEAVHTPETVAPVQQAVSSIVGVFGIPKNSTLHFFKNDQITATLLDDNTVSFDGNTLTFTEAAKAAFKKSGALGMATGIANWLYNGTTLKALKEQNA